MKAFKWLDNHFEEAILVILLVVLSFVQLAQVIFRNVTFIPSLKWAEEFSRFCWIWTVFLSVPYTIRKRNMLRVTVILDLFPAKVQKMLNIVIEIVLAATMSLLAVHSVTVVKKIYASGETSPAMVWPMWIIYSIMVVGFSLSTVRALQQVYLQVVHFRDNDVINTATQTKQMAKQELVRDSDKGGATE